MRAARIVAKFLDQFRYAKKTRQYTGRQLQRFLFYLVAVERDRPCPINSYQI